MNSKEKIEVFKNELKRIDKEIEDLKMVRTAIDGYVSIEKVRIMIDAKCVKPVVGGKE